MLGSSIFSCGRKIMTDSANYSFSTTFFLENSLFSSKIFQIFQISKHFGLFIKVFEPFGNNFSPFSTFSTILVMFDHFGFLTRLLWSKIQWKYALTFKQLHEKCPDFARGPAPIPGYLYKEDFPRNRLNKKFDQFRTLKIDQNWSLCGSNWSKKCD